MNEIYQNKSNTNSSTFNMKHISKSLDVFLPNRWTSSGSYGNTKQWTTLKDLFSLMSLRKHMKKHLLQCYESRLTEAGEIQKFINFHHIKRSKREKNDTAEEGWSFPRNSNLLKGEAKNV